MRSAIDTASESSSGAAVALGASRAPTVEEIAARARRRARFARVRFALLAYAGSRVLLLIVAIVNGSQRHVAILNELSNWDGFWYRWIANQGYPDHVLHVQTRLGFFPLYPIAAWLVGHPVRWLTGHSAIWSISLAGVLVSIAGGFVATVIVGRLAEGWWGPRAARRAVLLFCLFPGSVVFSMVYAEGLVIPLAAGTILALERRRWLLAGVLAGLATACEPEAVALILVCAVSSLSYVRVRGWRDRSARRSLVAPVLSATGAVAFAAFLWSWTGSPFATFIAQHTGWHEKTDPFALIHLASTFAKQISFAHFDHPTINLNLPVGLIGALVLIAGLILLAQGPRRISLEAAIWTLGIGFLAVTSEYTPPNPRLLITAFPAVLVFAYRLHGRSFNLFLAVNAVLLAGLSALTFHGITLRP